MDQFQPDVPAMSVKGMNCWNDLGFRVEKWSRDGTAVEALLAATGSRHTAFAAYDAAVRECPDELIILVENGCRLARSRGDSGSGESAQCPSGAMPQPAAKLTAREREVLSLLLRGMSMKGVAINLGITARTVAFHKYHAMEANGLRNNVDLVEFGRRQGF